MHSIVLSAVLATLAAATPILETRQSGLSGTSIKLLPLGDSITWGYDDPTGNGYRGPLYNSLKSAGVSSLDFVGSLKNGNMADPDNEGHVGWTISQIAGATSAISNLNPNVVLLHAGTNDAIQQNQAASGAISNLESLCDQIFKQWPNTVLLLAELIPEMNQASRQTYINQINAAVPGIVSARASAGKKIAVVDMHNALVRSDYVEGTHPTQGGYAKMAALWLTGLQSAASKGWFGTSSATTTAAAPSSTKSAAPTSKTTAAPTSVAPTTTAAPTSSAAPTGGATAAHYGQCGGTGWSGPTVCASPYTCKVSNAYYSQCL